MFKQGSTKKHVSICESILSILAYLAHLAQSFFLILNGINE